MWWDEEPEITAAPAWAVTFGDMMSLLLTFFIVLVSFGSLEQSEKFQTMVQAMQGQFGDSSVDWSWLPEHTHPPKAALAQLIAARRMERARLLETSPGTTAPPSSLR